MKITINWLYKHLACVKGRCWFRENFPRGGHRDEVLKKLEEANELDYYFWLLPRTLVGCPLPEGWVLPEGLEWLSLGGGTLPAGTQLPEGLKYLYLGGGTLPKGTQLPESLRYLHLGGGTLPAGTVLPEGLKWLFGRGGLPPDTRVPGGCTVYD